MAGGVSGVPNLGEGRATPHRLVNPPSLPTPSGFSHAVVAEPGRHVFVAGQVGAQVDGAIADGAIDEQFGLAAANVVRALEASGAGPEHVVSLLIYVTDIAEYRERSREIGVAYRLHFGHHYPAMALLGVSALFDRLAKVELIATAVIPPAAGVHPRSQAGKGDVR